MNEEQRRERDRLLAEYWKRREDAAVAETYKFAALARIYRSDSDAGDHTHNAVTSTREMIEHMREADRCLYMIRDMESAEAETATRLFVERERYEAERRQRQAAVQGAAK